MNHVRQRPEDVGVRQSVHELDLPEHVGSVAGQDVHLQSHHLARHPMLHLDETTTTTTFNAIRYRHRNVTFMETSKPQEMMQRSTREGALKNVLKNTGVDWKFN